jgi:hypothetical protein
MRNAEPLRQDGKQQTKNFGRLTNAVPPSDKAVAPNPHSLPNAGPVLGIFLTVHGFTRFLSVVAEKVLWKFWK